MLSVIVAVQAAVRLSRLAKAANEQTITALEPLHSNLALCPVSALAFRLSFQGNEERCPCQTYRSSPQRDILGHQGFRV